MRRKTRELRTSRRLARIVLRAFAVGDEIAHIITELLIAASINTHELAYFFHLLRLLGTYIMDIRHFKIPLKNIGVLQKTLWEGLRVLVVLSDDTYVFI